MNPSSRETNVGPQPTRPFIPNEIIAPPTKMYARVGVRQHPLPALTISSMVDSIPPLRANRSAGRSE